MRRILEAAVLLTVFAAVPLLAQTKSLPEGWFPAGNHPADYEMAVDPAAGRTGGAAYIKAKSATPTPNGFGTIMQDFAADAYRGKRLRLTGYVRTADITGWVGLWMRIDGPNSEPLGFDNMQTRPVKGTQNWQQYSIVLDVPVTAKNIAFGMLQSGAGQSWMDDLAFEVVDNRVPVTSTMGGPAPAAGPKNLRFDQQ